MSGGVVDLFPRLVSRPIRLRVEHPRQPSADYQRAAIRDDVCISTFAHALASHGLTFSTHPELGLVIHPMPPEAA